MRTGLIDLEPLRTPAFRAAWIGGTAHGFGHQAATVAVLQQTWDLTRSPLWTGALGVATAVPMILVGPVGGVLADAVDRRVLIRLASAVQLFVAFALVAQMVSGVASVALLFGLVALLAAGTGLGAGARRTLPVRLLPTAQVPAGIALTVVSFQVSMLAGPAAAGALIAIWSPAAGYGLLVAMTAIALLATTWLPALPVGDAGTGRAPAGGWAFLLRRRTLRGSFATDLAACLLAFPVSLFPLVNELRYGGDPRVLGAFLSALAVGGLIVGLFSGALTRIRRAGVVQLVAAGTWGLAVAGFGTAGSLWAALACLVVAGAADSASVMVRGALVQMETPDVYRGRVSSAEIVVGIAGPELGNLRGGLVAALVSGPFALVSGGLAATAVVGWVALRNRALREYTLPGRS
ncbi:MULTISPECIES: MFS transporter [Pseudonocardia]|uniref:Enterobactin exporter EntS n=2 Tax=Pseudonocardia TaxID=1847 RepID=A0A1Y2MT44_PSEAH|nr:MULTISPECIES: MFS transporter [Pseudonocardia]OSY38374.1 enterobactin exporter EntS [Pseudonocardia autotrophica]TDN72581.1 putative MFS family arabinose efflux permease [Pseudonocardia autotrophica]BBG03290.1 MFS transporter [Pseudonocardia autotrophica]GEC24548.1 MFS transporter [Pseudonocardia saturnea]